MQAFLSLDGLDSFLADRLFTVVSQGQDSISFDQLVIAKANCLKVHFTCHSFDSLSPPVLTCTSSNCTSEQHQGSCLISRSTQKGLLQTNVLHMCDACGAFITPTASSSVTPVK